MFPTLQWDTSNFHGRTEISYSPGMKNLKEVVELRLKQLDLGAVEAATKAGIERTYIRDIVEGRKRSVRSDKLPDLARALKVNAEALSRGEILPTNDEPPKVSGEKAVKDLLKQIDKLPEAALHPLWIMIDGYIKSASQSKSDHSQAQTELATPPRGSGPSE